MKRIVFACLLFVLVSLPLSGMAASPLAADVDAKLLELSREGKLTVRALQGFGLLDEGHRKLILELRSKGKLDALSANGAQIDTWLADAASGKLDLTPEQRAGLAQTRELFREIEAQAVSSPTVGNVSGETVPAQAPLADPPQSAAGSQLLTGNAGSDGEIFGIVSSGTKEATMKVVDYARGRAVFDLEASTQVVSDFVSSGRVEEEKGVLSAYIDFLSPVVGGIEAFTHIGTGGGAFAGALGSFFGEFGGKLSTNIATNAGYANLLIAAVQTYDDVTTKGLQHRETGVQVYKNILGNFSTLATLFRGPYVTSARAYALNLGFAAVYIFGFTLDSLVEEAQAVRSATIKAVHAAYYSAGSNYYITDDGWYRNFARHYDEAMKNPSDPTSAFQAAYSGMQSDIEQYVTGYWNHGENDIFTVLEAGRRFNYEATPKEREYLNAVARRDLYKRLNASVLPRIQRYMLTRFSEEAANALDKMCEPMNTRCRIRVFESQPDEFTERTYAGYVLRFAHTGGDGQVAFATGEGWTHRLPALDEDPAPVDVEMTVLGYLECGAPNTLLLFGPGADSNDPAKAERTIPFQLDRRFLDVDIRGEPAGNVWALTRIEPYNIEQFGKYSFEGLPEHMDKFIESSASPTAFRLQYTEVIRWKDKGTETRTGGVEFSLPRHFEADVDGSLKIGASYSRNEGFVDRKGKSSVGMFIILDTSVMGQGTRAADETVDVSFSPQLEPGRVRQAGAMILRGKDVHTIDVGLWHATGLGLVPKYGARYTYEWMPFAEAKGRQPEIRDR
ncbi:MAG: hypothetical protein RBR38_08920 [Desulfomicrobium apsheronum]|nr:hypothetical protein [Desulfomicrobium apsheronum]